MDLFVVNRHEDIKPQTTDREEQRKLKRVLKRIEQRKKAKEQLKAKHDLITKVKKDRAKKRELKASIIPLPNAENDEYIDENISTFDKEEEDFKVDKKQDKTDSSKLEGFTVLGTEDFNKKIKVKRVLPRWLSNPTVIAVNLQDLKTKVSDLNQLDKSLQKALKANGIKKLFPVQATVIPYLLEANKQADIVIPSDICVSAPTGSGKTLAFVLPVIQALKSYTVKRIRAVVILPTQDLALQVFRSFKKYAQNTNLDVCLITGKSPFVNEQKQLITENKTFGYLSKVDILVCTAGRLVDHINYTKGFNLQHLKFLVIDEADRVLETVQNDWLYHLEKHMQDSKASGKVLNLTSMRKWKSPQKLLFSATLSQDPEKLQKLSLFQPKLFTSVVETAEESKQEQCKSGETFIGKYTTPNELTEKYIICSMDVKPLVLYKFITSENLTRTLIFTHSVESAHRLSILLKSLCGDTLKIEEISSNLERNVRNTLMDNFSKGNIDILVCTDSLARGMDFAGVQCVISYSAPKHLKTYIHRVGRTARAGEFGLAVTILHNSQFQQFQKILQQANKNNLTEVKISEDELEVLSEQYKDALQKLKETVFDEGQKSLENIKRVKRHIKRKRTTSVGSNHSSNAA